MPFKPNDPVRVKSVISEGWLNAVVKDVHPLGEQEVAALKTSYPDVKVGDPSYSVADRRGNIRQELEFTLSPR